MAEVDVLIPVFNGARFVRSAVDTIRAQTLRSIRIVVVDDGSTDATGAILAELAAADDRVDVLTRPNGGIVAALNDGLGRCTAPFVARHDADDLAYPDRLERQLGFLRAHPDVSAVGCAARFVDEDGRPTGETSQLFDPAGVDPAAVPAREPYLLHPFLLARRDALAAAGGYRYVLHAEDADLYWRMGETGRLVNMPDVLGDYRQHGSSVSSASVRNGRELSVSSQRAALSAVRRRAGRADLAFGPDGLAAVRAASGSLGAICEAASDGLDADERRHLRIATAAKLVEQSGARPYELDGADCRFIRAARLESGERLGPADRAQFERTSTGAAARLARAGRIGDAARLLTGRSALPFGVKLAVTALLPRTRYQALRRAVFGVRDRLRPASARPPGSAA